jgi:hypothetical protein
MASRLSQDAEARDKRNGTPHVQLHHEIMSFPLCSPLVQDEVRAEVVNALGPAYANLSSQTIARFFRATGGKPKNTIKRLVSHP